MIDRDPGRPWDADEKRRVLRDLQELRAEPPPKDPRSVGCIVAMIALVALVFLPVIARATELGTGALLALGGGLGLVTLVGVVVGVFGGGFVAGSVAARVEEAISDLIAEFPNGDPDAVRRAAIRILDGSTVSTGPTTVGTFERDEVAARLGDALPHVKRIERFLCSRNEIYACFTLEEGFGGDMMEGDER